jgi:adenylate cyclase
VRLGGGANHRFGRRPDLLRVDYHSAPILDLGLDIADRSEPTHAHTAILKPWCMIASFDSSKQGGLQQQSVKNIARPVWVYALRPEAVAKQSLAGVPLAAPRWRYNTMTAIAVAVTAVLVIALVGWGLWSPTRSSPTGMLAATLAAQSISQPLVAPRRSIVVLPFANLSGDREQQYFVDGITEDLTTDLSRIEHMLVVSRNTAFTYKDKPVNGKQIGRELGVRYVLEGSVRRSGNQARVNAQLIDADSDAHLWAERFDHNMDDLFPVQNEVTSRIAVALGYEVIAAEATRSTPDPDALDYIFR